MRSELRKMIKKNFSQIEHLPLPAILESPAEKPGREASRESSLQPKE